MSLFRTIFFSASVLVLLLVCGSRLNAQGRTGAAKSGPGVGKMEKLSGSICEEETAVPLVQVGVLLLDSRDSSLVNGTITDVDGRFVIHTRPGDYILKIQVLGYQTSYFNISVTPSQEGTDLGRFLLSPENQVLSSSIVSAKATPVKVVLDTVVYNAAAYNVAEDASLGDLLDKIPGLEIVGNTVTLNGRRVTHLKVNGKKFFGGDVKTGITNLTADMVQNLKTYEDVSDFTRLSGIDDGEREPVIDVTVKKELLDAWNGNARLASGPGWDAEGGRSRQWGVDSWGGGPDAVYESRVTANLIGKNDQVSIVASARNTPSRQSFNSTRNNQLGSGGTGDRDGYEAGVSFSRDRATVQMSGHIHFSGSLQDVISRSQSETVNITSNSFSATQGHTDRLGNVLKGDFTLEWRPDKYKTLFVKPILNLNFSGSFNNPFSSSFSKDPLLEVEDPCDFVRTRLNSTVNQSRNRTANYQDREEIGCTVIFTNRSRNKAARTHTYRLELNGNFNGTDQYSDYYVRYFKSKSKTFDARKLFIDESGSQYRIRPSFTFSEPLGKRMYLQGNLSVQTTFKTLLRDYYNIMPIASEWTVCNTVRPAWQKASLPVNWDMFKSAQMSSSGRLVFTYINAQLNYRYSAKKFTVGAGVSFIPQFMTVRYSTNDEPDGKKRSHCFNFAPMFQLRYNPSKTSKLNLNYSGWSASPSLNSLLPVINGQNPLYQSTGNPDLKPSFTHRVTFSYNFSKPAGRFSLLMNLEGKVLQDAVSNSYSYDSETGIRTTIPCNINGCWEAGGNITLNKTFRNDHFSLSNAFATLYTNDVTNLYNSKTKADERAVLRRLTVKESFNVSYRIKPFELVANLGGEYTDESSTVREDMRQRPFNLRAGATATFSLPWKMRIVTEFTSCWQRGYSYDVLNRNFYFLNAGISQSFLKGRLVLRAEGTDLLGQGLNLTRRFATSSRSVAFYNGDSRYALLSLVYRFRSNKK